MRTSDIGVERFTDHTLQGRVFSDLHVVNIAFHTSYAICRLLLQE